MKKLTKKKKERAYKMGGGAVIGGGLTILLNKTIENLTTNEDGTSKLPYAGIVEVGVGFGALVMSDNEVVQGAGAGMMGVGGYVIADEAGFFEEKVGGMPRRRRGLNREARTNRGHNVLGTRKRRYPQQERPARREVRARVI